MSELFEHLDRLRNAEGKVALATLVNTRGTTPRKEGAKMWVGEGGRILGSVTIGGCVDAQVIAESDGVLRSGAAKLLSMALGDEDAWDLGLSCSGTVDVLVEPMRLDRADDPALAAYDAVRAHVVTERGVIRHAAIVTRMPAAG